MTSSVAQWRLDTLSASARETAEIASLGAGQSLSAWLAQLITETCAAEGVAGVPQPEDAPFQGPKAIAPDADDESEPDADAETAAQPAATATEEAVRSGAVMVAIAAMSPAGLGTRSSDDAPDALCTDIATRGVRQPLVLRRAADASDRYEIICGHRRWRAAQRTGLARIPAMIAKLDDMHAILASLAENLESGDLSPMDEAHAYLRLLTRCTADVAAITAATGRDRQHVIRSVRLLGLPARLRRLIADGSLSAEHADLLLDATNPEALAEAILGEHLNPQAARERLASGANMEARP